MTDETKTATPLRNPSWDEMTDAQRLAALRDAVVWMARDLTVANEQIAKLGKHQHAADGSLVGPLYVHHGSMNENGYSPQYAHNLKSKRDRG